jgi:hypothetical protein
MKAAVIRSATLQIHLSTEACSRLPFLQVPRNPHRLGQIPPDVSEVIFNQTWHQQVAINATPSDSTGPVEFSQAIRLSILLATTALAYLKEFQSMTYVIPKRHLPPCWDGATSASGFQP